MIFTMYRRNFQTGGHERSIDSPDERDVQMNLGRADLVPALSALAIELGSDWSFDVGSADAYGLKAMNFAQVRSRSRLISVRVWYLGSEFRVGAFLGVPYEASDEARFRSTAEAVGCVRALCLGEYERRDGRIWVKIGRHRLTLTEWSEEIVDPADPWRDGI